MSERPSRIVSLLPSATDLIFELGLGDHLLGVSHCCDHPGAASLPVLTRSIIGSDLPQAEIDRAVSEAVRAGRALYTVDGPLLDRLRPDLVVTQGVCEVCAVTPGTVAEAVRFLPGCLPAEQVLSLEGKTFAGILADLRALARAAGVRERGEALAAESERRWNAIRPVGVQVPEPPRVLTLEWVDPPFYGGHWVPEQVAQAGGKDVLGHAGRDSGRTSWEDVVQLDPDVIVVMCCGYGLSDNAEFARQVLSHPELRAVRAGQVWGVDANAHFSRPSLGVVRGAEVLAALLRGEESAGESVRVRAE